jgi:D-alanine-D-alanine ligase
MPPTLRDTITADDEQAVRDIVASTGFFAPAEVEVAVELVHERLTRGDASGYFFIFAEIDGRTVGYSCYGPIACTVGSFDLYWIAVRRDYQHHGLGHLLMHATEKRIARAAGRRIYIETSSRAQYEPTRRFYERTGCVAEAVLKDFYTPGDDKVVYSKAVVPSSQ